MPYKDRLKRTCGYLDVEDEDGNGQFFRRYFILDQVKEYLMSYVDNPLNLPDGAKPKLAIKLNYISLVNEASKQKPKIPFCFVIHAKGRQHYLSASSCGEMQGWITALKDSCKITVPKLPGQSANRETQNDHQRTGSYRATVVGDKVVNIPWEGSSGSVTSEDASCSDSSDSGFVGDHGFKKESPIKAGWCLKQGIKVKSWKKRFFVLNKHGVSYYKAPEDKLPLKTILLEDVVDIRPSVGVHPNKQHIFEIVTRDRVFYIQCNTCIDMQSWIESISKELETARHEKLWDKKGWQGDGTCHPYFNYQQIAANRSFRASASAENHSTDCLGKTTQASLSPRVAHKSYSTSSAPPSKNLPPSQKKIQKIREDKLAKKLNANFSSAPQNILPSNATQMLERKECSVSQRRLAQETPYHSREQFDNVNGRRTATPVDVLISPRVLRKFTFPPDYETVVANNQLGQASSKSSHNLTVLNNVNRSALPNNLNRPPNKKPVFHTSSNVPMRRPPAPSMAARPPPQARFSQPAMGTSILPNRPNLSDLTRQSQQRYSPVANSGDCAAHSKPNNIASRIVNVPDTTGKAPNLNLNAGEVPVNVQQDVKNMVMPPAKGIWI